MAATYKVTGMKCQGCVKSVTNAIKAKAPGAAVSIALDSGTVSVDGLDDDAVVAAAVDEAGFGFEGRAD